MSDKIKAITLSNNINPSLLKKDIAFSRIQPQDFVRSLQAIIHNPELIHQNGHPICGVSVALKVMAEFDPVTLVKMAVNFFIYGEYTPVSFLQKKIKVNKVILENDSIEGMEPAAYVLQFSIKSFLNKVLKYHPLHKNNLKGITFPWQIRKFLINYFNIELVEMPHYRNGFEYLLKNIEKGNKIVALTSWNQLKKPSAKFKYSALHYVIICGIEKEGERIKLYVNDSSVKHEEVSTYIFDSENALRKAVRLTLCFNKKGFKEKELRDKQHQQQLSF